MVEIDPSIRIISRYWEEFKFWRLWKKTHFFKLDQDEGEKQSCKKSQERKWWLQNQNQEIEAP